MNYSTVNAGTRRAWRVNDFCEAHGISRSNLYKMAKAGKIRLITIGGRTVVPDSESERVLAEGC